jgi:hypothetical protein
MASQVESGELCLVVSSNFFVQLKDTGEPEMKRMKTPSTLTIVADAITTMALIVGCQTATTAQTANSASQKEAPLAQSGFKAKPVTTPKQQQHVSQLA